MAFQRRMPRFVPMFFWNRRLLCHPGVKAGLHRHYRHQRPPIGSSHLGCDGMFGTNPLTIGIPTDEDFDFILDCATSITQNGKIEYYIRTGEPVHQGTVRSIYENRRLKKELYKASKQA